METRALHTLLRIVKQSAIGLLIALLVSSAVIFLYRPAFASALETFIATAPLAHSFTPQSYRTYPGEQAGELIASLETLASNDSRLFKKWLLKQSDCQAILLVYQPYHDLWFSLTRDACND